MNKAQTTEERVWASIERVNKDIERTRKEMEKSRQDLKEFRQYMNESKKRSDIGFERLRKVQEETSRIVQETSRKVEETSLQIKKTEENFNTEWEDLLNSLTRKTLSPLLNSRGINVNQTSQRTGGSYTSEDGEKHRTEFDIIAIDGDKVVVVEVKKTLRPHHIKHFLSKIKNFKKYCTSYEDKKIYGAMAFLNCDAEADVFAEKQGFFVIKATGDSASLINDKNFKPKTFC